MWDRSLPILSLVAALGSATGAGCGRPRAQPAPPSPATLDLDEQPAPGMPATRARQAAAPAVTAGSPSPAAPDREARRPRVYRGRRIDVDLKEADLHNVFRLLAEVGGVNIVVSDDVKGTISLRLRRVPWDLVLDTVVATKKLEMVREHGIYRVSAR